MDTEDKEKNTLPILETILEAINTMRQENTSRFDSLEERLDKLENKVNQVEVRMERRFEDMRLQFMSFDVRLDRLEAMSHEALNVAYNVRADVKVLREEVNAWMKDVQFLQKAIQD